MNNVYIAGDTNSTEATFPVQVGPDLTYNGSNDSFLVKLVDNSVADVSLSKTIPSNPLDALQQATYTFTIANNPLSSNAATNIVFTDTVTGALSDLTATPNQGVCNIVADTITCTLGDLNPGASTSVTVQLKPILADQSVGHEASLTQDQTDPNQQDNADTFSNTVAQPSIQFDTDTLSVNENAGTLQIPIHLSAPSSKDIAAQALVTGTVTADDYSGFTPDISIPAGQTTAFIPVNIIDDSNVEPDETLILLLSNPINSQVGQPKKFTLTIQNNDLEPPKIIQPKPKTGGSGACFSCHNLTTVSNPQIKQIVNPPKKIIPKISADMPGYVYKPGKCRVKLPKPHKFQYTNSK